MWQSNVRMALSRSKQVPQDSNHSLQPCFYILELAGGMWLISATFPTHIPSVSIKAQARPHLRGQPSEVKERGSVGQKGPNFSGLSLGSQGKRRGHETDSRFWSGFPAFTFANYHLLERSNNICKNGNQIHHSFV